MPFICRLCHRQTSPKVSATSHDSSFLSVSRVNPVAVSQAFPLINLHNSFLSYSPSFLLAQHSKIFSSVIHGIKPTVDLARDHHTLSHIHPFTNPIILHSFNMANQQRTLSSTPFFTPHYYLIHAFITLSLLPISSKPNL